MRFRAPLLLAGKTATGFEVPAEVVSALGPGRRIAVVVTLGTHSYRSSVAPMGGVFMLPVSKEHRDAAGIVAGQEVEVDLQVDTAPREIEVPADLALALDAQSGARDAFDRLSFSNRQRHVLAVTGAKAEATRARRVAGVVAELAG